MKERIVIVGSCRTATGRWLGTLKNTPAQDLLAIVFKEAIKRSGIDPKELDEVMAGCCVQLPDAPNIARVAALKAGIPVEVPAFTEQRNCASGIQSITSACQAIWSGQGEIYLAGGTENMTRSPYQLNDHRFGPPDNREDSRLIDVIWQGLTDPLVGHLMGTCCGKLAQKYNITADEQDELAALSHQKAYKARNEGKFRSQIIPVMVGQMGKEVPFVQDETVGANISKEYVAKAHANPKAEFFWTKPLWKKNKMSELIRRVFSLESDEVRQKVEKNIEELEALTKYETVNAANACQMADGASAMVVMTEKKAKELGIVPEAYIVSFAYAGVEPVYFGEGPIYAIPKALKKAKLNIEDIDLFEINEAFAVQCLACVKALQIPREKLNVWGGAIALGHPVGATGSILTTKLIRILKEYKARYGVVSMCVGGGMGGALIIENYQKESQN